MKNPLNLESSVAVIGMALRLPGADDLNAFWDNLRGGVESIRRLSDEEVQAAVQELQGSYIPYMRRRLQNAGYVKAAATLAGIDLFDADFFGYNPNEAELMDPQQRLFLEIAWAGLEDAGYDPNRYPGLIGVFAGTSISNYLLNNIYSNPQLLFSARNLLAGIGNECDYLPTRVSYKLNLRGPSINVQTACSTSLVAIHLACQSLLNGECDMALAGGAIVQIPDRLGYLYEEGGMVAPDGHCRAFDSAAQGTVFSSGGVAVVVLKRLDEALREGDHIYGVIRGSAINNDGAYKAGFTAPAITGQTAVIMQALAVAGVDPSTISYIETHGTGTALGDPVEVAALTEVFQAVTDKKQFCALGSVKTNVGHLAAVAGVTGLIKTVLALHHRELPPSLNFSRPNPRIDFSNSPFFVNTRLCSWENHGEPRRAGVSSFGVGGTNAHVVLEEAPATPPTAPARPWQLLVLSARTPTALETMTARLSRHLQADPTLNLADVAYTLHLGRQCFPYRRAVVVEDLADAGAVLSGTEPARLPVDYLEEGQRPLVFMFSGQGSQYVNMGLELYEQEPVFRQTLEACVERLKPLLGLDLRTLLYPPDGQEQAADNRLKQTALTQPALFTVEYALARLLIAWGVEPKALLGHSIGEYVAACLAGVFSMADALALVAMRGRLMQSLPAGGMLAVNLPETQLLPLLDDTVGLAAVNAPGSCVVSGPEPAIQSLERQLAKRRVDSRRLHTSHAFHSPMMDPILASFRAEVAKVARHAPRLPLISNVTGTWGRAEQFQDPDYWARHLRSTVRFAQGIATLLADHPRSLLLEVGPGNTLSTLARRCVQVGREGPTLVTTLRHPTESRPDRQSLLNAVGRLWMGGVTPAWQVLYPEARQRLSLPTYPFERRQYWIQAGRGNAEEVPVLGKQNALADWFYTPTWTRATAPRLPVPAGPAQTWLVFADTGGLGVALGQRLAAAGQRVITVTPGPVFEQCDPLTFRLRTSAPQDYLALWQQLAPMPQRVVHAWGLDRYHPEQPVERYKHSQELGFYSLLYLAKAIGQAGGGEEVRIDVLTDATLEVIGGESRRPEWATLLGPCKVIPLEYPKLKARYIDLDLAAHLPDSLLTQLWQELQLDLDTAAGRTVVAYRNGHCWVQSFARYPLSEPQTVPTRLQPNGVYLITGGLGGLGLAFAEDLARHLPVRLALLGRGALPPRDTWAERLAATASAGDPTARRIRAVQQLETLGADVLVLAADVTDEEQMRAAVQQIHDRFGPVNGVIHAAGIAGGGVIQLKTQAMAEAVLAPKVLGTLVLERVLAPDRPSLWLLCSSLFAVTGGMGQVDYCAANNFLDAYAQAARTADGYTVAVDWDAWEQVGMAAGLFQQQDDAIPTGVASGHPLLGDRIQDDSDQTVYLARLGAASHWLLDEHRLQGQPTLPGTACLEMARAAAAHRLETGKLEIRNVFFLAPLSMAVAEQRVVQLVLNPGAAGVLDFTVSSRTGSQWRPHVTGQVTAMQAAEPRYSLAELATQCDSTELSFPAGAPVGDGEFLQLGPHWRTLRHLRRGNRQGLAEYELPAELATDLTGLPLHPALLDMATGPASGYLLDETETAAGRYLPLSYTSLRLYAPLPRRLYVFSRWQPERDPTHETVSLDITLLDEHGRVLVDIESFTLKRVPDPAVLMPPPAPAVTTDGILPAEGVAAWQRILASANASQVVVSTQALELLLRRPAQDQTNRSDSAGEGEQGHHPRPVLQTPYAEPSTDLERALVEIWQAVLGLERVGVHDNFFELGMDSVLGIQIVAKARNRGLQIVPNQIFEKQTIAELAAALGQQGAAVTPTLQFPLLPTQLDVFEQPPVAPGWQLSTVPELEPERLQRVAQTLLGRHPALRLRFSRDPGGSWRQESITATAETVLTVVDAAGWEIACRQPALDPTTASLLRLVYCPAEGDARTGRLLLCGHPLVADDLTHVLLLSELAVLYAQPESADRAAAPAADTFLNWVQAITKPGQEELLAMARTYWLEREPPSPLQLPLTTGESGGDAVGLVSTWLDPAATAALLGEANRAYNTQPEELLLTAVVQLLVGWTGQRRLSIEVIGQGRDALPELPAAGAIGCFACPYPLVLELTTDAASPVPAIKEQRRAAPQQGVGYGLLRRSASAADRAALDCRPVPPVRFSYWGVHSEPSTSLFTGLLRPAPQRRSDQRLVIGCGVSGDRLVTSFGFDPQQDAPAAMTRRLTEFTSILNTLIASCLKQQETRFTPSDFPAADLNQQELDTLIHSLDH